jgi:hypothetical protein
VENLYATIISVYQDIVQYNNDNRITNESMALKNLTIDVVCDILNDSSYGTPMYRMAEVNSRYLDAYGSKCSEVSYSSLIKFYRQDDWANADGGRQWVYQTCTEFGYYQTTDSLLQPFGQRVPLSYYIDQCTDIFGPYFNQSQLELAVNETNTRYGGLDIKVTRVVFPNGSIDPWHALGELTEQTEESPTVYINGTAHCADMYPSWSRDPDSLNSARAQIESLLTKWISQ